MLMDIYQCEKLVADLKAGNECVSLSLNGEPLPTTGYAFSPEKETEAVVDTLTPAALQFYVYEHRDRLALPNRYLGIWKNPVDGLTYIDVSTVEQDRARAFERARKAQQLAVYDIVAGESIYLNSIYLEPAPQDRLTQDV